MDKFSDIYNSEAINSNDIYSEDFEDFMLETVNILQQHIKSHEFQETVKRGSGLKRTEKAGAVRKELESRYYDLTKPEKRLHQIALLIDAINNLAHIYDINPNEKSGNSSDFMLVGHMLKNRADLMLCKDKLIVILGCECAKLGGGYSFSYTLSKDGKEGVEVGFPGGKACNWHLGTSRNASVFERTFENTLKARGIQYEPLTKGANVLKSNFEVLCPDAFGEI